MYVAYICCMGIILRYTVGLVILASVFVIALALDLICLVWDFNYRFEATKEVIEEMINK